MKRRWWLFLIGAMLLIAACGLAVWQFFVTWPCSGDAILQEMDTILRNAQSSSAGVPSEEVSKWALLTVDSPAWSKLRSWMANAAGKYQLVLLALDQPFSPGDDAMVGVHLSSGIDIECAFYNSTLTDCSETDRIVPPEERVANEMKDLLQAARDNPTGLPPEDVLGQDSYLKVAHHVSGPICNIGCLLRVEISRWKFLSMLNINVGLLCTLFILACQMGYRLHVNSTSG